MVNKLKNVNFMSGTQFDTVEEVSQDELYAVNIENDATFKSFVSGIGMPSSKYIDLTLGSSGSAYTAPANGYVQFSKNGNINQYGQIASGVSILNTAPFNGSSVSVWLPIKKGDSFIVSYDLSGSTNYFRFYYAEGETN